ncbi:unnamed protein product [Caenorhabditis brenneri]
MTFPFLRLPFIVNNEVIRSLGHKDCIILALTSKRAAKIVRMANIKASFAVFVICPHAHIYLWKEKVILFPNHESKHSKIAEAINSRALEKWTDQSDSSIVKNTVNVYNEVKNLFRTEEQFTLVFSADYKKVTTVKEVLSDPTMKNWGYSTFNGETIELEELNMFMDMASPTRSFKCNVKEFPIDFRHEKAFKFRDNDYEDARWVEIEDLYKLRNCQHVTLGRNNFTKTQIKEFISYWVNSSIDMFWWMKIGKAETFDLSEILDGLTLLHIQHRRTCLTMAPYSKTREKRLLFFTDAEMTLTMSAWAPGEFRSRSSEKFDMAMGKKEGVMELLVEKKQLELEKESADEKIKKTILDRLKQLDEEIEDYGVFYVDEEFTLVFSDDYKKVATVKEVLSDPTLQNWESCFFECETIDLEELNMIMGMATPDREFICEAKNWPAFKFKDCEYKDARWVKIGDLYELKNVDQVVLERANFTQSEIKDFINYWVNSDIDMFWCLDVETEEAFDPDELLEGLTILHVQHTIECFTMAKPSESRKSKLLSLYNTENCLLLTAWSPGEFASGEGEEYDKATGNKEEIIELLIEKKRLELELESADKADKQKILKRLRKLDNELDDYGVFFVNDEATLRAPRKKNFVDMD